MAKRIGKYKVSEKDSLLSLADGGNVNGALSVNGTSTVQGASTLNADAQLKIINPVSGSATAITVSEAAHAGRTVMIPQSLGALVTHLMPLPTEGVKYHFVYVGAAVANEDIEFSADASGADFEGTIIHHHEGADEVEVVYCTPTEDVIDLKVPQAFELTFVGKNATTYYVYGQSTSALIPTCS